MAVSKIDPAGLDVGQIGGRRNLIINGAMQVAQRGTVSLNNTSGYGGPDRFQSWAVNTDNIVITQSQESDGPSGFSRSFKIEVTTAESALASDEYFRVVQGIEGLNLQQLAYGTSSAKELTLSFWVKSSVTGTYAVSWYIFDANRNVGATYTVNSANTWEYKTVTLPADTSGSLPNDDNTAGAYLNWALSAGSNWTTTDNTSWDTFSNGRFLYGHTADIASTLNATWQITGVQLEVGSVATPFEHRSYGEELALCQRYYEQYNLGSNTIIAPMHCFSTSAAYGLLKFTTTKRASPSITLPPAGTGSGEAALTTATASFPATIGTHSLSGTTVDMTRLNASGYTSAFSAGNISNYISTNSGTAIIEIDAEL